MRLRSSRAQDLREVRLATVRRPHGIALAQQPPMSSLVMVAFLTGVATTPHCVAMCGPLATYAECGRGNGMAYHGARLVVLTLIGGLAGWLGEGVVLSLDPGLGQSLMSLVLALALGASAVRLWREVSKENGRAEVLTALGQKPARVSRARALLVGAITPVLPCAAVWSVAMLAVGSASAPMGSAVMLAFGIPTALAVHASATTLFRMGRVRRGRRALSVVLALGALVTLLRPLDALRHGCVIP